MDFRHPATCYVTASKELETVFSLLFSICAGNDISHVEGLGTLPNLMELVLDRNKIKVSMVKLLYSNTRPGQGGYSSNTRRVWF